ncbi:uncharacterized protein FSUBG_11704 [Fusarium subglutinans]|uniref:Uncharacterized protein n=1 Tax=Gibberella subglutinans TaxID=42677 RepID=A0A8H5LA15_GIBSU|nr:uncharacterized protein FSUBG_11704 [Fusarium subglutinans]KAF5587803.1 hypothetical protein FSUBG_11704 [Fusarium subglutinans]
MGSESANFGLSNGITEVEEPAPIHDHGFLYTSNHEPPQNDHRTSQVEPNSTLGPLEHVFIEDARSEAEEEGYDSPANYTNLTEIGAGLPVESPDEQSEY